MPYIYTGTMDESRGSKVEGFDQRVKALLDDPRFNDGYTKIADSLKVKGVACSVDDVGDAHARLYAAGYRVPSTLDSRPSTSVEGWNDEAARLEELYLEEGKELAGGIPCGQQPVSLALMWFTYINFPNGRNRLTDGVLFVSRSLRAGEFSGVVWTDKDREEMMPEGVIIYAVPVRGLRPLWKKLQVENEQRAKEASWLGGDPAANELDPDREEDEGRGVEGRGLKAGARTSRSFLLCESLETKSDFYVATDELDKFHDVNLGSPTGPCVVDVVASLPPWDAQDETFQRCHKEGREYAEELIRGGSTVPEILRNSIAPCPHPFGVPQRVWWIQGLLAVLDDASVA